MKIAQLKLQRIFCLHAHDVLVQYSGLCEAKFQGFLIKFPIQSSNRPIVKGTYAQVGDHTYYDLEDLCGDCKNLIFSNSAFKGVFEISENSRP